jgi:MFS family permease
MFFQRILITSRPLLGPVIGPIGGGFLAEAKGWRWVFWLIALAIASLTLVSMFTIRESYAPTLLSAKTARLRRLTGNQDLESKYHVALSRTAILTRALIRPTKMLIFSPIVLALSCYMALVYCYLYLLFTTLTSVFERTYHFRTSLVGLTYLGLGMGMIAGMTAFGFLTDKLLARTSARSPNRTPKPEDRLPPMLPAALCVPIGLLIYGWSAHYGIQWMVPIIGTTLVGLGLIGTFMPILMYLVDAFTIYAASATAANTVLRSLGGALLPLAGGPMYARLGLGWGNTLLALVAAVGCLLPWVFLKYGERIRVRWPIDL